MDKQKFELLEEKVRQWFVDKGLADGDPKRQWLKLQSEFGELCDALAKNDKDEFIDAVGDMMVVLTGLTVQTGSDYRLASICDVELEDRNEKIYYLLYRINANIGHLIFAQLGDNQSILEHNAMYWLMAELERLMRLKQLSLYDCYETAYNVISKRKGKTVDGVFIKEEQ